MSNKCNSPITKVYQVSEIFYSIQGEGLNTGTPAVFIRMAGCNLSCPWCDTDHRIRHCLSKKQIVSEVKRVLYEKEVTHVPMVVITGGEPMLQYDSLLHEALKASNKATRIAVETNGTIDIPSALHDLFVTVSPKNRESLRISRFRPNEIKIVLTGDGTLFAGMSNYFHTDIPRFVQPCWDDSNPQHTQNNIQRTVEFTLLHPEWRLSLQTQKLAGFL